MTPCLTVERCPVPVDPLSEEAPDGTAYDSNKRPVPEQIPEELGANQQGARPGRSKGRRMARCLWRPFAASGLTAH